ncbi:MAG: hypothetical protein L0I76_04790 [Pseudonocardia sp.]|nr:hypothetical protein [Pseudonocardia sp.]
MAKDSGSGEVGCPSVHREEDTGRLLFQGEGVDMAHLPNALPGEQAVVLDEVIVRDAVRALGWL